MKYAIVIVILSILLVIAIVVIIWLSKTLVNYMKLSDRYYDMYSTAWKDAERKFNQILAKEEAKLKYQYGRR